MFTALLLDKFKAFGERQVVPLRPLTLIFGPNACGKSTILQALLVLKQTLESGTGAGPSLALRGDRVDLGGYADFVYGGRKHDAVEVGLLADSSPEARSDAYLSSGLSWRFHCDHRGRWPSLTALGYFEDDLAKPAMRWKRRARPIGPRVPKLGRLFEESFSCYLELEQVNPDHSIWAVRAREVLTEEIGHPKGLSKPSERFVHPALTPETALERLRQLARNFESAAFCDFTNEVLRGDALCVRHFLPTVHIPFSHLPEGVCTPSRLPLLHPFTLLDKATSDIERGLESIVHLTAIRARIERLYQARGNRTETLGREGAAAPYHLAQDPTHLRAINRWLGLLDLPYVLHVERGGGIKAPHLSDAFALVLEDKARKVRFNAADVGLGVAQLLPIIVACTREERSILCIEEPESHVHPAMQARIGDLLIDSALGRRKNQVIVETHSEHLLLRVLRRMRETAQRRHEDRPPVRPQDVALLFVERAERGSRVVEMELSPDGRLLTDWPGGFFAERLDELV